LHQKEAMSNSNHPNHSHRANKKILRISLCIITLYMLIEFVGGVLTNSLALLADAGHMLSDALSLFIALLAFTFSNRIANYTKTYGYRRFEILAALFNGVTLIGIAFYIIYEGIERFQNPPTIASQGMFFIACMGLLVNILVAWIMARGADVKGNLNMRGAYLHVISDMLGSIGAIVAALLILFFGWSWADPLASMIVALLVLRSGYLLTKSSLHVLMEGTPVNVDIEQVLNKIMDNEEVKAVRDLHVWSISSGLNALTCHLVVTEAMTIKESVILLHKIEHELHHLNIHHSTIQLKTDTNHCTSSVLCDVQITPAIHEHHH